MTGDGTTNVPFARAKLEGEVDTLTQRLAELRYVDEAIAYVNARHQMPGAGPGPRYDQIKVTIGWTYPLTRPLGMYVMPSNYPERVSHDLAGLAETASTWASNEIAVFHYLTTHIIHPDVASYNYIVDEFRAIARGMDDLLADLGQLSNDIAWWKGDQAQDFAAFQSAHKDVVKHQQSFVTQIANAFAASKGITRLSQHSLQTAVVAARAAADEQLEKRSLDRHDPTRKQALMIASGLTAVLAAMSFKVVALSAALTGASVSLGYAAAQIPEDVGSIYHIEGRTADELSNALFEAVKQISLNTSSHLDDLHEQLSELDAGSTNVNNDRMLIPRRPSLADGVDPAEFRYAGQPRPEWT